MPNLQLLNQTGNGQLALAGQKAAALGGLINAGFPVPPGLVLTTSAYALLIAPLRSRIAENAS